MPGLNTKVEWNNSPLQRVMKIMLETYRGLARGVVDSERYSAFYTPYQFTLPILQNLYSQYENPSGAVVEKELEDGQLKASNPDNRQDRFETSLRAVAYLSWEPESRIFLVRRVFPTYFDFLSVSHIPEGWGVSSIMLNQLEAQFKTRSPVGNGSFFTKVDVDDPNDLPYTLPYLAEQKRLRYKNVLILPVFNQKWPESDRDMLGTFLFFVNAADGLPGDYSQEDDQFRDFAVELCRETAALVSAHNDALAPSSLPEEWRSARSRQQATVRIAEVELRCDGSHQHDGRICKTLEGAARQFLKLLTIPNYYAIRDLAAESKKANDVAVFLITAQPNVEPVEFKKRLLRTITDGLSESPIVCQVAISSGNPVAGGVFHLKADCRRHAEPTMKNIK
jgi:hypothetical protein